MSIGGIAGVVGFPREDRAPRRHWTAERKRENVRRHRSQEMVELYD